MERAVIQRNCIQISTPHLVKSTARVLPFLFAKGENQPNNEKFKHKDWRRYFDARFHIRNISRIRDDGSGPESA